MRIPQFGLDEERTMTHVTLIGSPSLLPPRCPPLFLLFCYWVLLGDKIIIYCSVLYLSLSLSLPASALILFSSSSSYKGRESLSFFVLAVVFFYWVLKQNKTTQPSTSIRQRQRRQQHRQRRQQSKQQRKTITNNGKHTKTTQTAQKTTK